MAERVDTVITSARVVTADGVVETDVTLAGGRIRLGDGAGDRRGSPPPKSARRAGRAKAAAVDRIDARGMILLPGFIDIHTHGYAGFDLTLGVYDAATDTFDPSPDRTRAALERYVLDMPRTGLTTSCLATMADVPETLRERMNLLADFLARPPASLADRGGTRVVGGFLEGTFISDKMVGAMNPALVQRPDPRVFDHINASGVVKLALVAPDCGDPAVALIRHMSRHGVVVGAGHTNATADQLRQARRAGLRYMVHFLNGPTGHNFKPFHGGGAVEGALGDDAIYCELIADGYHVNPRYVRDLVARKGPDRVVGISDSMFAAGTRGLASFQMNGVFGRVSPDGKYLSVATSASTLFGSCLDMATALGNLVSWLTRPMEGIWVRRHEALPLDDALVAAARMTSTSAARLVGLDRRLAIGEIADGRRADLVLARLKGKPGAYRLQVERTFVDGRQVYAR